MIPPILQHALCIVVGAEYRPAADRPHLPLLAVVALAAGKLALLVYLR